MEAQKVADGTHEKLRNALLAQKRAEENFEIEKFRTIELEQAWIEASQKKEDKWQRELEAVRNQHAVDVASLLSTNMELQHVQHDLASAIDAKNQALSHADDATRIAEFHAEKNQNLLAEIIQIDSKLENEVSEKNRMLLQLKDEITVLTRELERGKGFEEKLIKRDVSIEHLRIDLEATRLAESYACSLAEEWKKKVDQLKESQEEANKLERSASESLNSVIKQLERSNDQSTEAESEISSLKDKAASLEMTLDKKMCELQEARHRLAKVEEGYEDMNKAAETLRSNLDALREEKSRALSSEKVASSSAQSLLEEKAMLVDELKISKEEEEKSKKAMESLASALHEASAEARDAKEKLVCIQIEHENWEAQMEDIRLVLKATKEKYERMLHDTKGERDHLAAAVKQSNYEYEASKGEWEQKELRLVDCLKQSEREKFDLQKAKEGLEIFLKQTEEKAYSAEGQEALLRGSLKEVEDEVVYLQGALGETKAESMKLKKSILDKENELQSLIQDNEKLQVRESASLKRRIDELSQLLEEANLKIHRAENCDLSDSEGEYNLLPRVVEFSEENGHGGEEKHKKDALLLPYEGGKAKIGSVNGETKEDGIAGKEEELEEPDSMAETNGNNSLEYADDGGHSPSKEQNPKKKKALLRKFGSLLKKKDTKKKKKKKDQS